MSTAPHLLLRLAAIAALSLLPAPFARAEAPVKVAPLSNATIVIIRHAEKPEDGMGLSPEGERRAQLYVDYFAGLLVDGKPLKFDHLFAAADSKNSARSRLTITPLSRALRLPLDVRFDSEEFDALADELHTRDQGRCLLVCWHQGTIPGLLEGLGANARKLLPDGDWPKDVFNWAIILRYDATGRLIPGRSRRIIERWAK